MEFRYVGRISPAEQVLGQLTTLIESGRLAVGSLLPPERQLALEMGVSRVVIREAAKKLEQRGLVNIKHGVGIEVVNDPSIPLQQTLSRMLPRDKQRLRQCAEARLLIEPELAALAASRTTPAALRRLEATHEALGQARNISDACALDIKFHDRIAELAGNKVMGLMLQSVAELGRLSRRVTMERVGPEKAYGHHKEIFAAIASGNSSDARKAMKRHMEAALKDLS